MVALPSQLSQIMYVLKLLSNLQMSRSKLSALGPVVRTQANSQSFLLDMMTKMVAEQRQTNKLIQELIHVQKRQSPQQRNVRPSEEQLLAQKNAPKNKSSVIEQSSIRNIIHKQIPQQEQFDCQAKNPKVDRGLQRIERQIKQGQKMSLKRLESIDKNGVDMLAMLQTGAGKLLQRRQSSYGYNAISLKTKIQLGEEVIKPQEVQANERQRITKQFQIVADKSKNYSILKQILPFSDKREIKAKISIKQIISNFSPATHPNIDNQTSQWLGVVYQVTASICSNMLFNNLLTFEETKILFTQNIIYNFIQFMKEIYQLGYDSQRFHLTDLINVKSGYILNFLCKKYPQTKIEAPNIALKSLITQISKEGRIKYDLLAKSGGIKKSQQVRDYAGQIMQKINYMIDKSNEQYDFFENFMKNIFQEVYLTPGNRQKKAKQNIQIFSMANKSTYLTPEDQKYKQKVQSYTKYLIGRKIPKNTEKYSEEEIQDGVFFVKTPGVLRILVKWVEQLSQYVLKPQEKLKNSYSQFKDHNGNPLYIFSPVKNGVYALIIKERDILLKKLQQIKLQCYQIEAILTEEMYVSNEDQKHLSQEQTQVGKYCNNLKSAISSVLCSQLNEYIQFLLGIPLKVNISDIGLTTEYVRNQAKKDLLNLNLVTLRLFDLLRCKCTSNEEQMVWIMKRLLALAQEKKQFKIIRMKDRLNMGTRDILINAQINEGMVCEIQLSVTNGSDKKQQMFDKYNHFLYELKRSVLGPITENVSIWTTLEQRSQYFEEELKRNRKRTYHKFRHDCVPVKIRNFVRPIICKICKNFYAIPQTSLRNIKCSTCDSTFCGECYYESLNQLAKKQYVFEKLLKQDQLHDLQEYIDQQKPFPKSGFFVKKNFLKKELAFFIVLSKNKVEQNEITAAYYQEMPMMLLQTVIRNDKVINRKINKKQITMRQVDGEFYLNKKMKETQLRNMMIFCFKQKAVDKMLFNLQDFAKYSLKPQNRQMHILDIIREPSYISGLVRQVKQSLKLSKLQKMQKIIGNQSLVIYRLKHTFLLCQIYQQDDVLRTYVIAKNNLAYLKEVANQQPEIVSMESKDMTSEMDELQMYFGPPLFNSFVLNLRKLYLGNGKIVSIKSLAKLSNLSILYIAHNSLTTLEGIQKLSSLVLIRFDDNLVTSMAPLKDLHELKSVLGNHNRLTNCRGLQNLKNLKKLSIQENGITDTQQLASLARLEQLLIKNNPLDNLNSISKLSNLSDLSAGYTKLTSFNSLDGLKSLKSLALDGIGLDKIPQSFKSLRLTELWLSHNRIRKIQNLSQQKDLKHLSLKKNQIQKIQNLQNLHKIQLLNLKSNKITSLDGLQGIIDTLKILNIRKNPLQNISGFLTKQFSTRFTLTREELRGEAVAQFNYFYEGKRQKSELFFV